MKKFFYSLFYVFVANFVSADDIQSFFDDANGDFYNGNCAAAIEKYEKMLQAGYVSSEIFFNLASAYFKNGNIGKSVLNFERAKFLSPRDQEIVSNISAVKINAGLNNEVSLVDQRAHELSFNEWVVLVSVLSISFMYLLFVPNLFLWNVSLRNGLWAIWCVVALVTFIGVKSTCKDFAKVIFIDTNAEIKVAPTSSGPVMQTIQAGECAYVRGVHGNLVLVESDTFSGWTLKSNVEYVARKY